jgi:hypothetical protein
VKIFKYTETLVTNQNFWLHPLSDQNLANYNTLTMKSKLQFRKCLQKQQTFHHICRNTTITTHKSFFFLWGAWLRNSHWREYENRVLEKIWAKTAQSCLWLCYRLDNPGLSFQQSQEIFLCHKMSQQALGPTHSPLQCTPGLFLCA